MNRKLLAIFGAQPPARLCAAWDRVRSRGEAVRSIEQQLGGGAVTAECAPPSIEGMTNFKPIEAFPALVDAEIDLIVAAMACGLTRVSTLALGDGEDYNVYFPWLNINQ